MESKKGFTLIELLAVIVVLAIIALISVPVILNIIEKVDMKAYEDSVHMMVHAAELQHEYQELKDIHQDLPITYVYENNIQINENEVGLLKFNGAKPKSGTITITENKKIVINELVSHNGKWCAIKEADSELRVGKAKTMGCTIDSEEEAEIVVEDEKPCELAVDKLDANILYIDSVEDMYAFSESVNDGNNYSGKTVKLRNNLDFSDYTPTKKNKVCNTNDNTNGFIPIGTSSKPFSGTFEGNAKTISNLNINLPSQDNVGLFGVVTSATIKGLTLKDSIIQGGSTSVGSLIGLTGSSTITEIIIDNVDVKGTNYVGGVLGSSSSTVNNIILKNSKITLTNIGGFIKGDQSASTPTNSAIYNTTITASRVMATDNKYYSENCSSTNTTITTGMPNEYFSNLNYYETIGLDTYIGGDNNNSGYYFDYDKTGNIVIKSTENSPITFTLTGEGTKEKPYIIDNYNHWKEATSKITMDKVYFKLTSDIDFKNNKFYMMGSSSNVFNGTFEGGAKNISNIDIYGVDNVGIFGSVSSATIYALNIENILVNGQNTVGSLVGVAANSTIREIFVKDANITGANYTGGLVGNSSSVIDNIILKNSEVKVTNIGGFIKGDLGAAEPHNLIITSSEIKTNRFTDSAFISYSSTNYSDDCILNGTAISGGFNSAFIDDMVHYKNKVETALNGDVNTTGYFFDDSTSEIKVAQAYEYVSNNSEELTSEDPYVYINTSATDQVAPTCTLNEMVILSNGFRPKVTCTDNSNIESFRSYFDSTTSKAAQTYEQIGNSKSNITKTNTQIIYNGTWATTNKVGPYPTKGTCYYFRYGAQDTAGNYSTYVTKECYKY